MKPIQIDKETEYDLKMRGIKVLNVLMMAGSFAVMWKKFYLASFLMILHVEGRTGAGWFPSLLYMLFYCMNGRIYEAFLVSYNRVGEMIYSQMLSAMLSSLYIYLGCTVLSGRALLVLPFILLLAVQMVLSCTWCWAANKWYYRRYAPRRTAIIWDMRKDLEDLLHQHNLEKKFSVASILHITACLEDLTQLRGMDTVFLTGIHSSDRNRIIKYSVEEDITAFIIPRIGDTLMSGAKRINLLHLPLLRLKRYSPPPEYQILKRAGDIVLSLAALLLLSPLMLATAICIYAEDRGPVFYRQSRLTKDGKVFQILKFRSMRVDAEKDGIARLSSGTSDTRVTRIGRRIRSVRIDELPQLLNVLKGDMSLVGPRPERPEIAEIYTKKLPEFALRLQCKAGITGLAQVYGKYSTEPYDKLQMDLMYIENPKITEDLRILLVTLKILFLPESTEGIREGTRIAGEEQPKTHS